MANDATYGSFTAAQPTRQPSLEADYRRLGVSGLQTVGGMVSLPYGDPRLRGRGAQRIYQEMCDDASCGVLLYLIYNIIRGVKWEVRPHSDNPEADNHAHFIETCMNDLDRPWSDFIMDAMSMAPFGHAPFDTTIKKRLGKNPPKDPNGEDQAKSKYTDGKIGWGCFTLIGQDTIMRWEFDRYNQVLGLYQQAAPQYEMVHINADRLINFRNNPFRDNPEGQSMFRRVVRSWAKKRQLENIEGIGLERRLCGLPMMRAPIDVIRDDATPQNQALTASMKAIGAGMKNDEQAYILFPNEFDDKGNELFKFELLSGGDSASPNIGPAIDRYNNEIFRSSLADFLGIGTTTSNSGSYAAHADKTQLFLMGMRAYLRIICDLLNRVAIPRLFELNGMSAEGYPEIDHSPLDQTDAQAVCQSLLALSQAGAQVFPSEEIERRVLEMLGLPAPVQDDSAPSQILMQVGNEGGEKPQEVYPGDQKDEQGRVIGRAQRPAVPQTVGRDAPANPQGVKPATRIG